MPRVLLAVLALLCGTLGLAGASAAAPPPVGMPVQLTAPNACYSSTAGGGCAAFGGGLIMLGAEGIAVSDDGLNLYATGSNGGGVAFSLGGGGALTQIGSAAIGETDFATSGAGLFAASRDTGSNNGGVIAAKRAANGTLAFVNEVADSCAVSSVRCMSNNNGLYDVEGVAVSPDGAHVYAASQYGGGGSTGGAVTVFSRNATTQAIAQLQCRPRNPSTTGLCNSGSNAGVGGANGVAVSPDGKFVYVTGSSDSAVVGFNVVQSGVDAGKLGSEVNCLWSAASTSDCAQTPGMSGPHGLAVSPDGRDVYVSSFSDGVTALHRDPLSGVLSFNHCIRATAFDGCTADASYVAGARDVVVSPDGRYVYVSGGGALLGFVIAYARDASSGVLTKIGCLSNLAAPNCTTAAGLANAERLAITSDGAHVYVTSFQGGDGDGAVAAFQVEAAPLCETASVTVAAGGSVTVPLTCTDSNGEPLTRAIASGPGKGTLGTIDQAAGTVTYTAAAGTSGADAFAFTGSDGTNASAATNVSVTIVAASSPSPPSPPAPVATPRSKIAKLARSIKAGKLRGFHGTASTGVKRVDVALVRLADGAKIASASCKRLTGRGVLEALRLTRRKRCRLSGFLRASGTTRWSFTLKRSLAPGSYVLTSRATAKDGTVEHSFSARAGNRRAFRVTAG